MLFPIGDDNRDRQRLPWTTWFLLLGNLLVFFYQLIVPAFTYGYSIVPAELTRGVDLVGEVQIGTHFLHLEPGPVPIYLTLLSAMFMHGDWGHLIGNLLYLWIFGDNVEDQMGRARFLTFYLLCGLLASATHIFVAPQSTIPSLGASGAIAGVLGAYLLLFPQRKVRVFQFGRIVEMPALLVIGFWGLLQFWGGFGSLATMGETGGVAYLAHVGGFVAGLLLVLLFRRSERTGARRRGGLRLGR
jgi:membrane associated rhomboid family serine protease